MKRMFQKFLTGWKKIAHRLGRIQTVVLVTIFYFVILAPWGGLFRLFGWDPLNRRGFHKQKISGWKDAMHKTQNLDSLKRQS